MRNINPWIPIAIWLSAGVLAAWDGHPGVLVILGGYVAVLFLPGIVIALVEWVGGEGSD